ncbi:hypothetical protein PMAYCL1PPCAC_25036, partial [Pristionchus mayeri]
SRSYHQYASNFLNNIFNMRSMLLSFFALISISVASPPHSKTFPCVVMNHYTPQEFVECDTQCYAIKALTPTGIRTIRRGCAGKDDLLERARFELEHKIVLQKTDCRYVGSTTLRQDTDMTLTQQCCSTPFCNFSASSTLFFPLIAVFFVTLFR